MIENSRTEDRLADPEGQIISIIQEMIIELRPKKEHRPVTLDSSLDRDLGLDSLSRMELLVRIEKKFGVTLSERVFADAETPRDLMRALSGASVSRDVRKAPGVMPAGEGPVSEPSKAQTLVDVLNWHLEVHPDRPGIRLYEEEETITYRGLNEGARAVAAGLQNRGLRKGEPVAIMLPTGRDYFFSYLGILLAGGVPVPIYPPARMAQIEDHLVRHREILKNCRASTMITMPEAKRFGVILKSLADNLRRLATVEELSSRKDAYRTPLIGSGDVAFIQYTSGSTGTPKGVVLTHANLLANIRAMGRAVEASSEDVFVSWLPLYHDMGLIGAWLGSFYFSAPLVVMSPLAFIARPQKWLEAIHKFRGTLSAGPNFAYELCLKRLNDEDLAGIDLSSWRAAFNGAEPVSPDTLENFITRFEKYGFRREAMMPVYGLAESTVGLAFSPLGRGPLVDRIQRIPFVTKGMAVPAGDDDPNALRQVACGRPLPGHEIRIVDDAGIELPERREGRLQFRGPSATSGYFRNSEETKRLFQDGWLNSGDTAYFAGGDVFITGRTKDIIIRAGRNIYPQEFEEAINKIPGVRKGNVVVFGSTDPRSGTERLVVVAETRENDPEKLDSLRTGINALAVDLIGTPVDEIVLAPPRVLLKTSSGKIRRAANRSLYERGLLGRKGLSGRMETARLALSGASSMVRRLRRIAAKWVYAGFAWFLFGLAALVTCIGTPLMPSSSWRWAFVRRTARLLARAAFIPVSVSGIENLPVNQPYIIAANHQSYLDSFIMAAVLPSEVSFVAKAELAENPLINFYLKLLKTEYVERFDREKGIDDARRISRVAREGRPLLFFPEGTFTRAAGLMPFHMGAFVAAAESGHPVVPVAIRGTRYILRSGSWFPQRGAIIITIGKPVGAEQVQGQETWAAALRLRDLSREHILSHCGEPDLV